MGNERRHSKYLCLMIETLRGWCVSAKRDSGGGEDGNSLDGYIKLVMLYVILKLSGAEMI